MIKRIATSLIGLVVFFAVLAAGVIPFDIAVGILVAIMLWEYFKSLRVGIAVSAAGYIGAILLMLFNFVNIELYTCVLAVLVLFLIVMVVLHGRLNFREVFTGAFGTIFITMFMSAVIKIRAEYNVFGVLLIFISAWTTDTGAYFTGRFLGKHKLAPHISPKKTVEGSIGGIITSSLSCLLYLAIMHSLNIISAGDVGYLSIMAVGAAGSVVSQLGDLMASAIKRDCGVKDFGNLLPGHGGALDRFDSVLFVSPFIYFLLKLFM